MKLTAKAKKRWERFLRLGSFWSFTHDLHGTVDDVVTGVKIARTAAKHVPDQGVGGNRKAAVAWLDEAIAELKGLRDDFAGDVAYPPGDRRAIKIVNPPRAEDRPTAAVADSRSLAQ
jgi:hypothetical protein